MTMSESGERPVLKGLDLEMRQMVIDTVRQLKDRLLTREKILEFDKNEFFPEEAIREMLGPGTISLNTKYICTSINAKETEMGLSFDGQWLSFHWDPTIYTI